MRASSFALLCSLAVSAFGVCHAASPAPLGDAQILGIYIQVNAFDIETALLGRANAGADAERQLADRVATDHAGVRQVAFALGTTCKVTPSTPAERNAAAAEHAQVIMRLEALKGAAFDKAYLQHEVAFHRAAIAAVRGTLLPAASCADLKAHLKTVLPAFEEHLAHTERLARELGAM
jgi:putative membrane protein